ncbi:hypothetical protein ACSFA3_03380 [Variovorax sp. RHLX14]|uniref:hypothetical protein n=1 Tax=Variovorax sp. RHLX14 TaxID=1259731 RepID=UPI003F47F805
MRVDERPTGQFFWVILSAEHGQHFELPEALYYRPYRTAAEPQNVYWNALVLGMAELRRLLSRSAGNAASPPAPPTDAANSKAFHGA